LNLPLKKPYEETYMLKQLASILIIFTCFWTAQGQVSLPFRKEAPIATDLYWIKAYDLLEDQRLAELEQLLGGLTQTSMGFCSGFDEALEGLNKALEGQNKAEAERALTLFITRSIVLEIYALNTVTDQKERKTAVINLFKELIAIQKYIKAIDFDTYRQLVNCFRRLNQLHVDPPRLEKFIDEQEYLSKYALKC
jgi:hypothetical protein